MRRRERGRRERERKEEGCKELNRKTYQLLR